MRNMNSEEKFKDLLKQKLEGTEFPFNAGNWDKAQQLIDASREKKKRRAAFILWSLLLLILGVSSYFVLTPQPDTTSKADNGTSINRATSVGSGSNGPIFSMYPTNGVTNIRL